MSEQTWADVDNYLVEALHEPDASLSDGLEAARAAGLPEIQVSPSQGKLLHLLVRIQGARTILEVGTLGGYSTTWMARALPEGGHLTTLELEKRHAEVAQANLERSGVADKVEIRLGPAIESLRSLKKEGAGPFDFFFIDADKPSNPDYFLAALELSRPGSVIVVDNVVRGGKVADASSDDEGVRGVRRMHELMRNEPRLEATAIQTVGAKSYDGFTLALVS